MTFQAVTFGLDRQEEGGDKAREAAVRDARRQAEVYAAAAGVALGRLLEIREELTPLVDPQVRSAWRDPNNLSNCMCEFDKYERALVSPKHPCHCLRRFSHGI